VRPAHLHINIKEPAAADQLLKSDSIVILELLLPRGISLNDMVGFGFAPDEQLIVNAKANINETTKKEIFNAPAGRAPIPNLLCSC